MGVFRQHILKLHGAPLITGLRITGCNDRETVIPKNREVVLPKSMVRWWRGLIHRAIYEPELRPRVKGLISSLKPIYGVESIWNEAYFVKHLRHPLKPVLPPQLEKPYQKLLQTMKKEGE